MNRAFFNLILSTAVLVLASTALADSLITKDGQTVTGKSYRRKDDMIMVTMEIPGPDGKPMNAEKGILQADLVKVECPVPAILKEAPPLLVQGQASAVLTRLKEAAANVEAFGDLPGSPWPDLVILQAHIFISLGKDAEAAALVASIERSSDKSVKSAVDATRALIFAEKGDHEKAALLINPLLADEDGKDVKASALAAASVAHGLALMEKKEWVAALKCFISLPVFQPDETALSAMALLGSAKAYYAMEDFDHAIAALQEIIKLQPSSAEAKLAAPLVVEFQRRQRVVKESKD